MRFAFICVRHCTKFLGASILLLSFPYAIGAADPVAELTAFSVFDKIDLAELANSDGKTMHGPPMSGRYLSVQSCYVVAGAPARHLEALRQWNPTRHRELKVFLHDDLPLSPTPTSFSRLKDAPDNGPVRAFVSATQKLSADLQISRDEEKNFSVGEESGGGGKAIPAPVAASWSRVLAGRAKSFVSGGTAAQPPYDHIGQSIKPNEELNALLKQQDKIRRQFSDFLGGTGIGRGGGSITPELYWELLNVDDQGVLTLGASYHRGEGSVKAADVLYYASGGYYVALTLYQMWPVTVNGKDSTLVWRGDMLSSAALESLHGVERLGSESAMTKDIAKTITLLRRDTGGSR